MVDSDKNSPFKNKQKGSKREREKSQKCCKTLNYEKLRLAKTKAEKSFHGKQMYER